MKTDLKNLIKENCYDRLGNLSSTRCKMYENEIVEATQFLNDHNPKISERIYCILNEITEILRCPLTGEKLRFSPQTKEYANSKEYAWKNRVWVNKADHKKRNSEYFDYIMKCLDEGNYLKMGKNECIEQYNKITQYFTPAVAKNNKDLVCNVINYTKFLKIDELGMAERMYCIINNITYQLVDDFGDPLCFVNRFYGYSKSANQKNNHKVMERDGIKFVSENFIINHFIGGMAGTKKIPKHRVNITCKECSYTYEPLYFAKNWSKIFCPSCNNFSNRSRMECEIINFIMNDLGISEVESNNRAILGGYKELDIYLRNHNLAIEPCGLIWHSYGTTHPNNIEKEKYEKYKHQEKYEKCKELGIDLLTFLDFEWNNKRDVIESIIRERLNFPLKIAIAEDCKVSKIDHRIARQFIEENHLRDNAKMDTAFGLYMGDMLVSVASFHHTHDRGLIMTRFCDKNNFKIEKSLEKIIKDSKISNFRTYCDLRFENEGYYIDNGLNLVEKTIPNYWYTKDNIKLLHRKSFQKHAISNSGENRTEIEIMTDLGYRRFYDCGNLIFEYSSTK